ncbi:MAG TPA: glycosyltransferase [Candidatus Acidoferrales bacterium]|nr:glycosyltransferase [Candidatus Acidoferrales bacterium]
MILEGVVFFALLLATTLVVAVLPRTMTAHAWLAIPCCLLALAGAGAAFLAIEHDEPGMTTLAIVAVVLVLVMRIAQRRWSFVGVQLFVAVTAAALCYLAYAFLQTFFGRLPALAVVLSIPLLLLEILALGLSVSFTFEICDVLSRRARQRVIPPLTREPWVALQVPTYNEPVEVVGPTLQSLAKLDYQNVLVQVVDNNTSDPALWKPLEELCRQLGPRFSFVHLEDWPGFKAGALNEATPQLPPEVEILGIVDADYQVHPQWLRNTIGYFDDPTVAFMQTSQHYREWKDNAYLRGLFYSFRYFFDITMIARSHRNAIIFCGTMGLIRRSAFNEIGGWNQECITEDAEASLRMLGAGYRGVYDAAAYGEGLMPLDFDGLKKQRFRWALGGIQILKFHWREMVPFAKHRMRLTFAQRVHYLLGSVQWFAEALTATFTVLLLATALAISLHERLPVRQLTGAVLVVPLAFAGTGILRAVWAMRRACHAGTRDALNALRVWFALSWVVTLACVRGLVQQHAEFLRTAKSKDGRSLLGALRASRAETVLMVAGVVGAATMLVRSPSAASIVLAVLLLFEAFVYSNAPWASLAAEGIILTPERRAYAQSPQNTGDRPVRRRPLAAPLAGAGIAASVAAVAFVVLASPSQNTPFGGPQADLPRIGNLVPNVKLGPIPDVTPSPSASPSPSPSASATPSPTASVSPSPTVSPTAAPTPTPGPTPTPTPASPTLTPSP